MTGLPDIRAFMPECSIFVFAVLALFAGIFTKSKRIPFAISITGVLYSIYLCAIQWKALALFVQAGMSPAGDMLVVDMFGLFFKMLVLAGALLILILSGGYKELTAGFGEFNFLLLSAALAMMLLIGSFNLLMVYMSVEFLSITSYALVGFFKNKEESSEAAIKYFLFGALASGLMLYGISIIFGLTGTLNLADIRTSLFSREGISGVLIVSYVLLLAGFGFKISMAPFHMWSPDAYQGAPTPITALLSVGPKSAGFAVLLRVFFTAFNPSFYVWAGIVGALSCATMIIGNLTAIPQQNIKRLLAYSSISQAGYILIGFVSNSSSGFGLQAMLIYILAYVFMNIGAFSVIVYISNSIKSDDIRDYAGISRHAPFHCAALTIFLLSLTGLPPLAGFIGKFYIFASALKADMAWLAVVGVINSVIAAYYYFRIIRTMYFLPPRLTFSISHCYAITFVVIVSLIATLAIGIYPSVFLNFISDSANIFAYTIR